MTLEPPFEEFISQPFVCGAFGPDHDQLFASLVSGAPAPVSVLHDDDRAKFAASTSAGLERTDAGWTWGRYVARRTTASNPSHASFDLGLAGFWPTRPYPVVHTDWLGTQEIFFRRIADTTYWANRIGPLARLGRLPLTPDIEAWRTFLVVSGFWGGRTPFREITRLSAGEQLVREFDGATVRTHTPRWLDPQTYDARPEDVADALEAAMPDPDRELVNLTLSGGLDSRLLVAALMRRGTALPTAWSTPHESGLEDDLVLSRAVAQRAGIRRIEVDYGVEDWLRERRTTAARLEHATPMHNWFAPLAAAIRSNSPGSTLVDGLGGDVLMKYHGAPPDDHAGDVLGSVWNALGGLGFRRSELFVADASQKWERQAHHAWRAEMQMWQEHPFAETALRLLTRTRRSIASAPFRVFGPELRVITPLIDPEVVRVVLAVPPLPPDDRDLRRHVLAHLDGTLATIPSTADETHTSNGNIVERGASSAAAARSLVSDIRDVPEVDALFLPGALDKFAAREGRGTIPWPLRRAATLADWVETWRARLDQIDFTV